jgi:hypothetical protein
MDNWPRMGTVGDPMTEVQCLSEGSTCMSYRHPRPVPRAPDVCHPDGLAKKRLHIPSTRRVESVEIISKQFVQGPDEPRVWGRGMQRLQRFANKLLDVRFPCGYANYYN